MHKGHHWKRPEDTVQNCERARLGCEHGGGKGRGASMFAFIGGLAGHKQEFWFNAEASTTGLGNAR